MRCSIDSVGDFSHFIVADTSVSQNHQPPYGCLKAYESLPRDMHCIYSGGVFDWDRHNLKKIKAHDVEAAEVEEALSIGPIPIYEQDADGESRYVYYGETASLRLLAVVLTERNERIRVITAYELDAGQKRDYFERRLKGE